jgi:hypothetical protein
MQFLISMVPDPRVGYRPSRRTAARSFNSIGHLARASVCFLELISSDLDCRLVRFFIVRTSNVHRVSRPDGLYKFSLCCLEDARGVFDSNRRFRGSHN